MPALQICSYDDNYIIFKAGRWFYPAYMPAIRRGVLSLCEVLYLSRGKPLRCGSLHDARAMLKRIVSGASVCERGSFVFLPQSYIMQLVGMPHNNINGRNPHSKLLGWEDVREMRVRYAKGGISHSQLAEEYGCSKTTVTLILQDKIWREGQHGTYHGNRSGH